MESSASHLELGLARLVEEYRATSNIGTLLDRVRALAADADPEQLLEATRAYQDMPEVVIPAYEHIISVSPNNAQAMVVLANAYWLTGRGPEVVDSLARRAKEADANNRGAWHLWALAEPDLRSRVERWLAVTGQFPRDQLARAALADNASSLASTEDDPAARGLAIATYESLLKEATNATQEAALRATLKALKAV